jgi:hypothetical protein
LGATGLALAASLAPLLGAGVGDPDGEPAAPEDPDDVLDPSEVSDDDDPDEPSLPFDVADSFTLDDSSFEPADEERDDEVRLSFL